MQGNEQERNRRAAQREHLDNAIHEARRAGIAVQEAQYKLVRAGFNGDGLTPAARTACRTLEHEIVRLHNAVTKGADLGPDLEQAQPETD